MPVDKKFIVAFGKQVDKIRRAKGLTYEAMALACDLEKPQAHLLCNKGINVTLTTIKKVAKGLEVSVQELFDFNYLG